MAAAPPRQKTGYKAESTLEVFYTGGAIRVSHDGLVVACACSDEVKVVEVASGAVKATLPGDTEPITAIAIHPDGKQLFACSRSLQAKRWDLESNEVTRSWKPHDAPVVDMAIDPTGTLLATASADRTLRVWDIEKGFCTHALRGHSQVVLTCLFHPDPKALVLFSGGDDAEVRVWDLRTKKCTAVLKQHFSAVTCLGVSPCGDLLLSGGRDKVVHVWDHRAKSAAKACRHTVPVYEPVEGLVVLEGLGGGGAARKKKSSGGGGGAAGGLRFLTAGERGVVKAWQADTAKCLCEDGEPAGSEGGVVALQAMPGGAGVLAVTADYRLLFRSVVSEAAGLVLTRGQQLIGHNDDVIDLRFVGGEGSREGTLAVATNSDQIRIYDVATMGCVATLAGHTDIVLSLDARISRAGLPVLVSGAKDNSVRVWDVLGGRCLASGEGHVSAVGAVALSRRSGSFLVSGGADKLLKVWDLSSVVEGAAKEGAPKKLVVTAAVAAHDKDINSVAVAPNDALVLTGSQDRTAKLWRMPDLVLHAVLRGHRRGVWSCAFSPVDQACVTSSADKTVRLWKVTDGTCLKTFEGHTASVLRVDFLSAGTQLVSSGADGLIKLWSVRTAECVATFDEHEDKVWALAVGPETERLASGGADAVVHVWRDCTAEDEAEALADEEGKLLKEQDLSNALQAADYVRAAKIAFELAHPYRLLRVFQDIEANEGAGADGMVREVVLGFDADGIRQTLAYCREWNTNSKFCTAAQRVLNAVLRTHGPTELLKVKGLGDLLDGLLAHTQRHYLRVDRLVRSTYMLDFTLSSMRVVAPAPGADEGEIIDNLDEEEAEGALETKTAPMDFAAMGIKVMQVVGDDYETSDDDENPTPVQGAGGQSKYSSSDEGSTEAESEEEEEEEEKNEGVQEGAESEEEEAKPKSRRSAPPAKRARKGDSGLGKATARPPARRTRSKGPVTPS